MFVGLINEYLVYGFLVYIYEWFYVDCICV